jgi:hypothetical protein
MLASATKIETCELRTIARQNELLELVLKFAVGCGVVEIGEGYESS